MRVPKYRPHKNKHGKIDCALIEFKGERIYLPGRYKSAESREAYRRFLIEHALVVAEAEPSSLGPDPTVNVIALAYLDHALEEYGDDRGSEYHKMRVVAAALMDHSGELPVSQFGPKRLRTLRKVFLATVTRKHANAHTGRVKRIFGWAVEEELIPGTVWHSLLAVKPVKRTRRNAGKFKEGKKRKAVPDDVIEATLPELSPQLRDMVNVHRLIGCRSQSLCQATPSQFDRSEFVWLWRPRHKGDSLEKELLLPVGPRAQAILLPYIEKAEKKGDAFLFDPRRQRANLRYRNAYSSQSYCQAVQRAARRVNKERAEWRSQCKTPEEKAQYPNIPVWSPHQIRHAKGKAVRAKHGLEGSKAALGHETISMAELYSEKDIELAKRIAREMG